MIHWLANAWPYLAVGVVALSIALWIAWNIIEDEDDVEVVLPEVPFEVTPVTNCAWDGFADAHRLHPPKWAENDSWSPEFKVPANRA